MLNFKKLTLEDKILFDSYLKPYTFRTCEYSFTNLFIWRIGCDIQYTVLDGVLIIKKMDYDLNYHFMQPIGYSKDNLYNIVQSLIIYKEENHMDFLFKDVEVSFIEDLTFIYENKLTFEEDRDNFDYIYKSDSLISLSGKKLHGKKNHYNNFVKNNTYLVSPINESVIRDCIKTAREWCCQNDCKGYLLYELRSIEEMLKNRSFLDFVGIVVYVNDKLSAFTIGERMNKDLAIIHIEKADTSINGLYAFINKTFVEQYFSDVSFINREQDMGIEGLRKAKLSYQPDYLERKFFIK